MSNVVNPDGRLGLLYLLNKLGIIGLTTKKYSFASTMVGHQPFTPPPNSIQLAIAGLSLDFLQVVPFIKGET